MRAFTIGDFRFEVLSYSEEGEGASLVRWFIVDAFYQNQPLSWHPNQTGKDDFPGTPNRTRIGFTGKGGEFRPHIFRTLMRAARKAEAAQRTRRTISDVRERDVDTSAYIEPLDLTTRSISEATSVLTVSQ